MVSVYQIREWAIKNAKENMRTTESSSSSSSLSSSSIPDKINNGKYPRHCSVCGGIGHNKRSHFPKK